MDHRLHRVPPSLLPFGGVLKTLGRPLGCSLGENKERVSCLNNLMLSGTQRDLLGRNEEGEADLQ